MSRRISFLATAILLLFALAAGQSANIQFFRAAALDAAPTNPRITQASTLYARGDIIAADGTVLAHSVPSTSSYYAWQRTYPLGSLTSGVVGFSGSSYGDWALEAQYASYLSAHPQPPQSLAQVLAPTSAADSITLTLQPALQRVARKALAGQLGAAVVLNPRTGDVLAMYSNPNYDPAPLASTLFSTAAAAWKFDNTNDVHGFPPLGLMATQQTFPPGSTFKIITTAAAVVGRPDLLTKTYPGHSFITLPNSNQRLYNSGGSSCGGTVAVMLPVSCDPGYALLGMDVGATLMAATAGSFGFNQLPPLDLPGVQPSFFPTAASFAFNVAGLAYSSIGQENVRATALQNAMVAAAIANGGAVMTPHLLNYISGPDGTIIKRYRDSVWKSPLTATQAGQIVPLMQNVVRYGTAAGIFLAQDDVAAKTGTAQTGTQLQYSDDWMIAFAPATNPTVAAAVVEPFQASSHFGATYAGPVVKCLVEAALALQSGQPASGTSTTCPS